MDEIFIATSCKCLTSYSLYTKWPNDRKLLPAPKQ